MRCFTLTIALLLFAISSKAMRSDSDSTARKNKKTVFDNFQLRQSLQDASAKEDPAQLMLSLPSSGRSNWLVDAGIATRVVPLSGLHGMFQLVGEFHRNTLIDSAQYNWQAGINYFYFNPGTEGQLSFAWTGNLKYDRDVKDTAHSIATTLNMSFYRNSRNSLNLGKPGYCNSLANTYEIDPSLEVQYQQYLGNDTHTGALVRPMLDLSASYAWNHKKKKGEFIPPKLFEVAISYVNRYAIINNTGNGEGYTKLLRAGVNYYFLNTSTSTVSLGINYNRGSDPLDGLKDQNYVQFAFQVQI